MADSTATPAPAFTFAEVEGVSRVTAGRTFQETDETKALRASLAQGVALSDAQRDGQGFGKAIEFKMAKSGKTTESRTVNRKQKDGTVKAVQTKGGQDPSLVRVLRLIRQEAETAGRGLSVSVTEANKSTWLIRFQTRNRKASSK